MLNGWSGQATKHDAEPGEAEEGGTLKVAG